MAQTENLIDILAYNQKREADSASFRHTVKINFLRNYTVEGIEPFLKNSLYKSDIKPEIIFGNFNNIQQEILDENSHIYSANPDIIIVALCLENLLPDKSFYGWESDETFSEIKNYIDTLLKKTKALIAVTTVVPPLYSETGITNIQENKGLFYEAEKLNQNIRQYVSENPSRCFIIDVDRIASVLGHDAVMDSRFWYSSSAPYKKELLSLMACEIARIVRALKGLSKKCLILDCDNTLWEGIIGEDGIKGIKLDNISSPGKIFYDFQKTIIALYERGVTLCLCSKNNEPEVWDVLDNHPHSLIKRSHISAFRINWNDKATNIRELAKELNLGLDSFVFVDDNPVECGLVKEMIPEVTVLQVPEKLYDLPTLLLKDGLFDTLQITTEDKSRTKMYQEESIRKNEQSKYADINEYLASLQIQIKINEVMDADVARVAQLTQKTNQFNFTTKRYSENEISEFCKSENHKVFQVKVADKYGEMGVTGVVILKHEGEKGIVDTFLMSCRVLGRKVEFAFIDYCFEKAEKEWGIKNWDAFYFPTQKNQQIAEFWPQLGFEMCKEENGNKIFLLSVQKKIKQNLSFIKIN
jgi:FkbH-like protein